MSELIEFLTSKEIIVVYIVAAIACLLCFIIYLVDKNYYKRKQRHNTRELNKLVEEVNDIIDNENYEIESFVEPTLDLLEQEPYTAKVNDTVVDKTESIIEPIVETEIAPVIESVNLQEKNEVRNEIIEQLEIEELETLNVEDIVLETMKEAVVENQEAIEEQLEYTSIEPNKEEAQEELMRLTEELEKAEQSQRNIDLTAYEEAQEENAIISLEELVKKSKEIYEANEIYQYADEGNEPISLEDLEKRLAKVNKEVAAIENNEISTTPKETNSEEAIIIEHFDINAVIPTVENEISVQEEKQNLVLDDFNSIKAEPLKQEKTEIIRPAYQSTKKFERSPIISPIYGITRPETKEDIELENTANYEKLDEEIKKTNEFLMTLKELQSNLD